MKNQLLVWLPSILFLAALTVFLFSLNVLINTSTTDALTGKEQTPGVETGLVKFTSNSVQTAPFLDSGQVGNTVTPVFPAIQHVQK